MARFVCIEGFDGTGKSTIVKWLSMEFGFVQLRSPSGLFERARSSFDSQHIDFRERLAFYVGSCALLSFQVAEKLAQGTDVVVDRYYMSTLAYHSVFVPFETKAVQPLFEHLLQPDKTILLKTNFDIIRRRLQTRKCLENDKLFVQQQRYERIMENYISLIGTNDDIVDNNGDLDSTKAAIRQVLKLQNK